MLRLLHLSDIHFSTSNAPDSLNPEVAVRDRMLADIRRMHDELGQMAAVLVVGDIANRGRTAEYDAAGEFLNATCDTVGCDRDQVVCVPGNHDIDRTAHGPLHDAVRHQLRSIDAPAVSNALVRLILDVPGADVLLKPLANYNTFALRYGCDISSEDPVWAPKTLDVDGKRLMIHGITSPWIADETDGHETDEERLVVGLFQLASVGAEDEALHIALCHHPMRWLRDSDQIQSWTARAHLFLTGHEHEAGIEPSGDGRSLHVASGAVTPDREETGWIPAYNVIELRLADPSTLAVRIHTRTWQERRKRAEFGPDPDRSCAEFEVRLNASETKVDEVSAEMSEVAVAEPEPIASEPRSMIYRVMLTAPDQRRAIARELGLLTNDTSVTGYAADQELISRAIADGRLAELEARLRNG